MAHTDIRLFVRNLPEIELDEAAQLLREHYDINGDLHPLDSERDLNFRVDTDEGQYVLRFANSDDGEDVIGFQTAALRHIHARDPSLPIPDVLRNSQGKFMQPVTTASGSTHILRLVSYLPGNPVEHAPVTLRTWREIGRLMGKINIALSSFYHPSAQANDHPWDTANCLRFQP
ncbi:MAG: phosphotransferase, partial [Gammaproteobacteria bacterium]|nr:phosphotransferase [Gammaproteobacteria bacterium]